jgi:hypothetical protein
MRRIMPMLSSQQTRIHFEAKQSGMPPHPCFIVVDLDDPSILGYEQQQGGISLILKPDVSEKDAKELATLLRQSVESISKWQN